MRFRNWSIVATLLLLMPARIELRADEACHPVEGERIRMSDLASVRADFAHLDPAIEIGYAPLPGVERTLSSGFLRRLGARHGLEQVEADAVCFNRASEMLSANRVQDELRETLRTPDARIEIVEMPNTPVPKGKLRFERLGLYVPPNADLDTPLRWRGVVEFGGGKTFPITVMVRIAEKRQQVVALRELRAGEPISSADVGVEDVEAAPSRVSVVSRLDDAIGSVPRRTIGSGEPINVALLRIPMDVKAGDRVRVEVVSGRARLRFEADAESPGRVGDEIIVRNPESGKSFSAVVVDDGEVLVSPESL